MSERWHGRTAAEWEEAYRAERQARYHSAAERDEVERADLVPRSEAEALAEALERELDAGEREQAIAALKAYRAVYPREETP